MKGTKRATVDRDLKPAAPQAVPRARAKLKRAPRSPSQVAATGLVGRTYTYKVVRYGEFPAPTIVCRAPGETEGRSC